MDAGGSIGTGSTGIMIDKDANRKKKRATLEEEIMDLGSLEGGLYCAWRMWLFGFLILITGGLLFLLSHWYQKKRFRVLYTPCPIEEAEYILVTGWDGHFELVIVEPYSKIPYVRQSRSEKVKFNIKETPLENRMFVFKHIRYQYDYGAKTFVPIANIQTLAELYKRSDSFTPLTSSEHSQIQTKIGSNLIDIPVPNGFVLLTREVLHPFFMFQIYSVIVWSTEEYYYYAAIIFFMAMVTAMLGFWEVRSNLENIKKLSHFESRVNVIRDGESTQISSIDLVVGDVLEITPFTTAPCDMAVVSGSCVVDESMLTGESTPVLKVAVPPQLNVRQIDPRHMVYGGTKISEVRVAKGTIALGVVATSGYQTNKGLLVLSILFPKPAHFKFVQESMRFLLALFCLATIGFAIVVWKLVSLDTDAGTIVQRACDLITVVVPPALPMAAGVGTAFAVGRLKKRKIFCVSLPRINMAGKINYMCFDKTGTLTEEGLDFMCVVPVTEKKFEEPVPSVPDGTPLKMGLLTCHSLTHIGGVISGDTLEVKIFNTTNATLEEPHITENFDATYISIMRTSNVSYGVLTQFEFMPKLQRMSVLTRDLRDPSTSFIITKGSPEMIFSLAQKDTVPENFWEILRSYTHQGYRVLGIGYKPWMNQIPPEADKNALRDLAETDLIFLGFIVLQNRLKPETTPIITELKQASVRPVMITGDNILTGVSIGKGCGIVDPNANVFLVQEADSKEGAIPDSITIRHMDNEVLELDPSTLRPIDSDVGQAGKFELAVTGKAFDILLAEHKNKTGKYPFELIITAGTIWARMSPENKASLVEELMNLGWYAGMCGDGANDCMALRTAHVCKLRHACAIINYNIIDKCITQIDANGNIIADLCLYCRRKGHYGRDCPFPTH